MDDFFLELTDAERAECIEEARQAKAARKSFFAAADAKICEEKRFAVHQQALQIQRATNAALVAKQASMARHAELTAWVSQQASIAYEAAKQQNATKLQTHIASSKASKKAYEAYEAAAAAWNVQEASMTLSNDRAGWVAHQASIAYESAMAQPNTQVAQTAIPEL